MQGTSICKGCGKEFKWTLAKSQPRPSHCRMACRKIYGSSVKECQICGKSFRVYRHRSAAKYCSRKCFDKAPRTWVKEFTAEEKKKALKKALDRCVIKKTGCWEWNGRLTPNGYGWLSCNKKTAGTLAAHRGSYIYYKGRIPKGLCVLHTCHNRSCTNPNHLYLGTTQDNTKDRQEACRQAQGETQGIARLKNYQAEEIREKHKEGSSNKDLAKQYGVSRNIIYNIVNNRTYKNYLPVEMTCC